MTQTDATRPPTFPPLLSGEALQAQADPFERAMAQAAVGCDAGLIVYDLGADRLRTALVFAPEVPLRAAMAMLPTCGIGFQNALGALAPPEVAVHLGWDGGIWINGARCGRFRVAASGSDPDAVPDWLVIGYELPLWPQSDSPGETPDDTSLYAEGCSEVDAVSLLESWARHTLVWINRWSDGDLAALHAEWRGLAWGMGEKITLLGKTGTFLGVDEDFGMLLRQEAETVLIPLSDILES